jgi:hypothetical protein
MPISLPQLFMLRHPLRHSDCISVARWNRSAGRTRPVRLKRRSATYTNRRRAMDDNAFRAADIGQLDDF